MIHLNEITAKIKSESEEIIRNFEITSPYIKLAIHRAVVSGYSIGMEKVNGEKK